MEIVIGKFVITSDPYNVVLNEKRIAKRGKDKGGEYLYPIGYYSSVENCLEGLLDEKIRNSRATSIKELLEEIRNFSKFIRAEFKEAREGK